MPEKYVTYIESVISSGKAYSVRLVRKNGRYFAHVSFEISNPQLKSMPERVCAVDSNPEGFAVAIVKDDGNIVAHKFFRDDRLVYASEGKRDNLIGAIVKGIIEYAKDNNAGAIVIEDLNMRDNRSFGRRGNRVIHAFVRKKFAENIMERSWKEGVPVFTVNPAYTSKIGDRKYREMYGLSIHESAALCIGRRFYGYGEWLNEPITVGKPGERVPVQYVWTSLYGYGSPKDPYMEPPGRKGSVGKNLGGNGQAVFTGRPAVWPLIRDEGERKGGERGGSPQATGNGVKPAPQGGQVCAASLMRNDMRYTNPKGC
ncbi:MAG: IS200/IS605 family accessory protein TnpB-related protein [Nitrososphaerota archaeon]|nr:IS200/IS605 family accessory protein TnpB-related protein [Nitrososphaerota archaeon]MDG6943899.1 IS200/IS605 family accessory protein TnpB-related protein [Nitrososphaerota archaeon]